MADTIKLFRNKTTKDVFSIKEKLPAFDFGARRGGVQDAVRLEGVPHGNMVVMPEKTFNDAHEEIPAAPVTPTPKTTA
jgi:hypothetical protein